MSIASELQDKINSKAAIKAAIEAKGVTVGNVKLNQYASKVDSIAQDPSIPVGTGQHLVTFYDFDGKVLKRERVATGGSATAPDTPIHQYLTFAEWNNPFTNVQSDIDTGAIYNTTDGKTYLFITLTAVTGLAPTLYFSKSSTSLMTIDWGDGTTSTSTTSGNQSIQHTYATAGDYIITVDNSGVGTFTLSNGTPTTSCFFGYTSILTKVYIGSNISLGNYAFRGHQMLSSIMISTVSLDSLSLENLTSIKHITFGQLITGNGILNNANKVKVILKSIQTTITGTNVFAGIYTKKIIFYSSITSMAVNILTGAFVSEIILLPITPPSIVATAFGNINPICKIYVPDASVNAYKTATNWVTYANYIYPLSQKPQSDE